MKKTLITLLALLMVGLMGFTTLGSISFCTETDGSDAWCFGDTDYLHFGTDRDAKMGWVSDSVVFTGDLDVTGAVDISGSLAFSGNLTVTGNLDANGTLMSLDGSTSVKLLSAALVDIECADIRFGLNSADYMKFVTTITNGNLAITHAKSSKVTWTAGGGFDFVGAFETDALTLSDDLTFSDGATIDNSNSTTLTLTEENIELVGATLIDGILTLDEGATLDNSSSSTELAIAEDTIALTGVVEVTGNFDADGTDMSVDGTTSASLESVGRVNLYSPTVYLGRDSDDYMLFTTSDSSGNLAITHEGTPAVTWASGSLTYTGVFEVGGASTFDAVTIAGNLGVSGGTTASIDASTSVRNISAGFVSSEATAVRFGANATEYMSIAVTATTGAVAITHTGNNKKVTWTTTGGFDFVGDFECDAITSVGNMGVTGNIDVNGTLASIDGSTSAKLISNALATVEAPDIRLGFDDSFYMKIAVSNTSGNVAITHVGGSDPDVTWASTTLTYTGDFEVVGASVVDDLTLSAVLTFSDAATIDNSDSTTLQLTEDTIDLVGATLADDLTLSSILTFSDGGTIDNSDGTTLQLTETTIDLVGATLADDLTLSAVLTFSDGGTIDNTAGDTLTIIEDKIVLTASAGVTVTDTGPFTVGEAPVVLNHQQRVTVGELIAGPEELLPAVAGRTYRIIDVAVMAYGGAIETCDSVDILGDRSGSVKLFVFGQANLTRSTVLTIDSAAGVTVLADGASFDPLDAGTAITASFTNANPATATGVNFIITYVLE